MDEEYEYLGGCFILIVAIILLFGIGGCVGWIQASNQAEVWRREGINVSTWEVFWGAKPVERVIYIK